MSKYIIKYNEQNTINKYETVEAETVQEALTKFYILNPEAIIEGISRNGEE